MERFLLLLLPGNAPLLSLSNFKKAYLDVSLLIPSKPSFKNLETIAFKEPARHFFRVKLDTILSFCEIARDLLRNSKVPLKVSTRFSFFEGGFGQASQSSYQLTLEVPVFIR